MNTDGNLLKNLLELKDFKVTIEGKEVVKGIDLDIKQGEIVVIMGPNGSGKSTLANGLMGHPKYHSSGTARLSGEDLLDLHPDERSKKGLFLSFQYPAEIPGVTVSNFLRTAINARRDKNDKIRILDFKKLLHQNLQMLDIPDGFSGRYLNHGFSGGEKKKLEILQLAILNPKIAILDETDSGLDIDALKTVCESINTLKKHNPELSLLIITHYQRMLRYLKPDRVCIMHDGMLVRIGGPEIVDELEEKGYQLTKEHQLHKK